MKVQHSARNDDWRTPPEILDLAKIVLGPIDLDPSSSELANQEIQANRIFTADTDGLTSTWGLADSIWLNPPGGRLGNKSMAIEFWKKLQLEVLSGNVGHAIFMAFSIEHLQSSQRKGVPSIMKHTFCVPAKRIAFVDPTGEDRKAPSHSNMIVYVPGSIDRTHVFKEYFSKIGDVN